VCREGVTLILYRRRRGKLGNTTTERKKNEGGHESVRGENPGFTPHKKRYHPHSITGEKRKKEWVGSESPGFRSEEARCHIRGGEGEKNKKSANHPFAGTSPESPGERRLNTQGDIQEYDALCRGLNWGKGGKKKEPISAADFVVGGAELPRLRGRHLSRKPAKDGHDGVIRSAASDDQLEGEQPQEKGHA